MTTPQYQDYRKLILSLAGKTARKTGQETDELVSLGNLAFCEARRTWDASKGKFSTHLTWTFKGLITQHRRSLPPANLRYVSQQRAASLPAHENPERDVRLKMALETLGQDAREVVRIVFNAPQELLDWGVYQTGITRAAIKRYLRGSGWSIPKIQKAFAECKNLLNLL